MEELLKHIGEEIFKDIIEPCLPVIIGILAIILVGVIILIIASRTMSKGQKIGWILATIVGTVAMLAAIIIVIYYAIGVAALLFIGVVLAVFMLKE